MSLHLLATEPCLGRRPLLRSFAAFLFVFIGIFGFAAAPAGAEYQEAHTLSDDVRIKVGADGVASIIRQVRYGVVAGRYKSFDIGGIEPQAILASETTVLVDGGRELVAHVARHPKLPDVVRLSFDEPKGVGRGTYAFALSYAVDLVAAKALERDGASWKLSYAMLPTNEGRDAARVVLDLPAAQAAPSLADPDGASTTLATLRRRGDRDELELVRAHVARGEAVTWSAHVDPQAFPGVTDPELRAEAPAAPQADPSRALSSVGAAVALCVVAVAAMLAYRSKRRVVARACAARGVVPRPLVPLRPEVGSVVYGGLVAAATASLLWANPTVGALLVSAAIVVATHLLPRTVQGPRGPGRWRPISSASLSAPPPDADVRDPFDLRRLLGVRTALLLVFGVAALAFLASRRWSGAFVALPLAASAAVPLFVTGTRSSLPWTPGELAERFLKPVGRAVRARAGRTAVRAALSARFREGASSFDEVRLVSAPEASIPGLRGVELALAPSPAPAERAAPTYELLVRFDDASEAAAKIARLAPGRPIVVGRHSEERVLRLVARGRSTGAATRLVLRVLRELEDRRAVDRAASEPAWTGKERRQTSAIDVLPAVSAFAPPSSLRPVSAAPR